MMSIVAVWAAILALLLALDLCFMYTWMKHMKERQDNMWEYMKSSEDGIFGIIKELADLTYMIAACVDELEEDYGKRRSSAARDRNGAGEVAGELCGDDQVSGLEQEAPEGY